MTTITIKSVVLRSAWCKRPGPEVEVEGMAEVTVKWKCSLCGCYHSAKV